MTREPDQAQAPTNRYSRLTAVGPAAIAILRITGPGVAELAAQHLRSPAGRPIRLPESGEIRRCALLDDSSVPIDDVLVSRDAVGFRLHLHGSPAVVEQVERMLVAAGFVEAAVHAAELWDVRDAVEADTLAALPAVRTTAGARWLLQNGERLRTLLHNLIARPDSPDAADRIAAICADGAAILRRFTHPRRIAMIGAPNAGKSTLINALGDSPVSIVSDRPGTTRDFVEFGAEYDGLPLVLVDTAGLRTTADPLERAGIEHTQRVVAECDVAVLVIDASLGDSAATSARALVVGRGDLPLVVAANKCDLPGAAVLAARWVDSRPLGPHVPVIPVSASNATGLPALLAAALSSGGWSGPPASPCAVSERDAACLAGLRAAPSPVAIHAAAMDWLAPRQTHL